ncbi:ABC transporter ATP-binding protein [Xanthobacter agilis]|uniref:ABC-2 type transport system ATP-binding protein n=1 Tax=Xanthobacter agilis TaxID=47492 RepID=A0ABU0LHI5_XANAG|nr:ABC transporter ATP-binding protein [Xanthobacter agilis]MDQ0506584.1 ABC-2 type transport system ATP-binding protein [Xanthobacter agilis]
MSPSHLHLVAAPAPPQAGAPTAIASAPPPLAIEGLDAGYGRTPVLHALSLTVPAGCVTALVGPNGAGKSTLIRAICGRLAVKAGAIAICGLPADTAEARGKIGLAPQDIALYRALTIAENLAVFAELSGLSPSDGRLRVAQVLERTGTAARQDERIDRLSGGWQRRANLAAALMGAPRLLLLDEPTAGVDASAREALAVLVRALAHDGLAVLLVTHDFEFAEQVADRAAILMGGHMALEGPLADLLGQRFAHRRAVEITFAAPPPALRAELLASLGLATEGATARGLISDSPRAVSTLLARLDTLGLPPRTLTLKTPGLPALYDAVTSAGV